MTVCNCRLLVKRGGRFALPRGAASRYNKNVMELVQIAPARTAPAPKPEWLKARAPVGENYHDLKRLARSLGAATRCARARSAPTLASAGTTRPRPS